MSTLTLPYRFLPRSYQARTIGAWQCGIKRFLDVEHRRGGKTKKWLSLTVASMFARVGTYAHVFPELKQAREIIWEGMGRDGMRYLDHFPPAWIYGKPNKQEMSITLRHPHNPSTPGSRWVLLGTDRNANALVGMNAIGIVWDEWAMQDPQARRYARPILAENGGWEAIVTTPRGENHAFELHQVVKDNPEWLVQELTVDDTRRDAPHEDGGRVITEDMIEADRQEGVDEETIEQEYYLSWKAAMPGAYYAKQMREADQQGRITTVAYDPSRPVITGTDFGISKAHDTNAWWFAQLVGNQVRLIDYYQAANEGVQHFVDMLREKPYTYRCHFAMETDLAEADWGTGVSRVQHFRNHGIEFEPVPKLSLADGHEAVRTLLNRCVFDAQACRHGINGLRSYRRDFDTRRKIFLNHPVHDWASHPEAAFRYLAVGISNVDELQSSTPAPAQTVVYHDIGAQGWMG